MSNIHSLTASNFHWFGIHLTIHNHKVLSFAIFKLERTMNCLICAEIATMINRVILTLILLLLHFLTQAQTTKPMYLIKLNGAKAELRQTNGNLVRYIGNNDVVYADINGSQDHVLVTITSGKVELRALNNNLVRYIGNGDALDARWNGSDILVRTKSGKLELRAINNNLIRTM